MEELVNISKDLVYWLLANNKSREDAISILRKGSVIPVKDNYKIQVDKLTPEWKNLIISYVYPRHIPDYQLPYFIQQYQANRQVTSPDINEVGIILEAYRGRVYVNFIRFLFHCFTKNEDGSENLTRIVKVAPNFSTFKGCPICGRRDVGADYFGSSVPNQDILLCPHCLSNLIMVSRVLDIFEPGFITNLGYLKWK